MSAADTIYKDAPKLSIITISYNNAEGLERTFNSVLPQLNDQIEYIIIDGDSSDNTKELLDRIKDKTTYCCSEKDNGIYNAMNKGVRHAKGEYCLFLNSGDYLYSPETLKDVIPMLNSYDIIYGDILCINPESNVQRIKTYPDTINAYTLLTDSLPHPASFIKRELLTEDPYNEHLSIVSDWEFFVRKILYDGCTTHHIHQTISVFIEDGISSKSRKLCDRERQECTQRLFTPAIIDICQQYRALSNLASIPEFIEIGKSRKLFKRIRPLLRIILRIDALLSGKHH